MNLGKTRLGRCSVVVSIVVVVRVPGRVRVFGLVSPPASAPKGRVLLADEGPDAGQAGADDAEGDFDVRDDGQVHYVDFFWWVVNRGPC